MKKGLVVFLIKAVCYFVFIPWHVRAQNQASSISDTTRLIYPIRDSRVIDLKPKVGVYLQSPSNIRRSVEYDPITKQFVISEKIGTELYRPSQYFNITDYQKYEAQKAKRAYWQQLADNQLSNAKKPGFIPQIVIDSRSFERIFGSSIIDIRPQGSAELTLAGRLNRNENPLFNERQRRQGNFDFNQRIQMNVVGQVGDKLRISTNYNTEAQFDFENQVKLDYTGRPDEIIQKIEAGNVSLPLSSSLITGSQALFGLKTQLQFGRLNVTSIFTQQKSQQREMTITNGSQQNEIPRITIDNYEANRHYFLAQYFRDNYNRSLSTIPINTSAVNITKIEVWVTNRNASTVDSRDVLAFLDLGENKPYNTAQVRGGPGFSILPAGFSGTGFAQASNNLLQNLPPGARLTNTNDVNAYFQANSGTDNYVKLTYARKLTEREFTLSARLGYISLNTSLNADEVLAVAYRYTINGIEYQVGEFTTDVPVDPNTPQVLYVKLLKNETLKTNLPTWDLMMKNIYSLGAYQISRSDFNLQILRLDDNSGVEKPIITEGANTSGKLWLQLTNLDNLNQQSDRKPDGYFDFIDGITIDPLNGRLTFPLVEPFGSDLASKFNPVTEQALIQKYVYQPLYDSTRVSAQQLFPGLNRYIITGSYQSQSSSEFSLNAINVPQGSVQVFVGTLPLTEGLDFTVDYNIGRGRILNQALLNSGQPVRIKMENSELFGLQQRALSGSRFDYHVSDKLNLGGTIMNLSEKPLTRKVNIAEEAISNTIWGVDAQYNSSSRFLTKLVDKLPFISTKESSSVTFAGEYANLIPGHPRALNIAGSTNGASYLDDFEGSKSVININSAISWQIAGTPAMFPESQQSNLSYGYNRARLAFHNLDPIFFNRLSTTLTPANIKNNANERSNHYVREVLEQEVFPFKQSSTGQINTIPTFDLAYYPMVRGPYNFTPTGFNSSGNLLNPRNRWGGIFRKLETTDFETLNIEFIELWVLDPFLYKPNSLGGDLYFNLGSISEDILKDGRKSLENGLPPDGDRTRTDPTIWGKVPKLQPVVQVFDNNPSARKFQDIGLDGLTNDEERQTFTGFLNQAAVQLNPQAASALTTDPASDDYEYYRSNSHDSNNAGILKRYERYNGTEGNSKTPEESIALTGIENSASTSLPDGEDINRDNNSSQADEYYQYKVSVRPQDLVVGQNFVTDKITSSVRLANGSVQQATWYQFKIPIAQFQQKVGNIQNFRSIRFIRMFMTDFVDTTVLRFARMQLVRGEWRRFNAENTPSKVLADQALGTNPGLDNSVLDVSAVNIEDNGTRVPIPYVVPPGIERERDFNNFRGDTRQNEQSLAVNVRNLRDGYARATFRTTFNDFRSYKRIEMFIHAEGDQVRDNDIHGFLRIGTDNQFNYYEYDIPLNITTPGSQNAFTVWPDENRMNIELSKFQEAKTARNNATLNGQPWPVNVPFKLNDGANVITIVGQPDMSKVRLYMLGVRNPLRNSANPGSDDGLDKTAEVWFNELRLTDFDEQGGWAATARLNAKLADFADLTVSGSKSTIGFGSIDKRVSERNRNDTRLLDVSSSVELGKFLPESSGIKIPVFINYSTQVSTPQFNPASPDIELNPLLKNSSRTAKDSIRLTSEDYTNRRSINFTNVRKLRTDPSEKPKLWDIENWSTTYAFTEYYRRSFIIEAALQKTYKAALEYNYTTQPSYISPFAKLIKSNKAALIRDINFNLIPSIINFRVDADRLYSENTPRNNEASRFVPIQTNFNKNFLMSRLYNLSWNLTRSLQIDFNATNYSAIDEPEGRITGTVRDSIWENLRRLGRTTDYSQVMNVNYTVPLNKIPGFEWVNLVARYGGNFKWNAEPLITLRDPTINYGNNIQNARSIQLNPTMNFAALYNKLKFIPRPNDTTANGLIRALSGVLTSIKNISGSYNRTEGIFLPGYLPTTTIFGYDLDENAPGFDFIFGSQQDIRGRAINNGWVTRDSLLNQLYFTTYQEDLNLRSSIEPLRDFRIELTALRSRSFNYSSNFKFSPLSNNFESFSPVTTGDYSTSFFAMKTAFRKQEKDGTSDLFRKFEANRVIVSARLGQQNPNSTGATAGFSDGYNKNSQDVLIASFLAAYTGKNAQKISLSGFPKIPIPNWRMTYNGLTKYRFFNDLFASFDLNHSYRSVYNVNGFSSLVRYREISGFPSVRDANNNFLPTYQFAQVTLEERFVPLIGIDVRTKNNMNVNFEYRKSRILALSLSNSQLAQQNDNMLVFGFGYRTSRFRFPFGLFKGLKMNNDLNFKMDLAISDRKTVIYRADVTAAEISSGVKNITLRPSADYILNQQFSINVFYDGNITRPYTSQTFNTSFSNFGFTLKFALQ